jgi:hypothetical protein
VSEIAITTAIHPRRFWITIPLRIGESGLLEMVLDTAAPLSGISVQVRDDLRERGLLEPPRSARYVLRNLIVQGQPFPDVPVRVSPRLTEVGADGVLGLDFLSQFTDIHFHVPTRLLTLTILSPP